MTSLIASALGFFAQTFARLTALGRLGAVLIMTAIVAVESIPRFRPPAAAARGLTARES